MKRFVLIIYSTICLLTGAFATSDSIRVAFSYKCLFRDSNLQSLINQALQSNIDLLTARQKTIEAETLLGSARSSLLPKVSADASGSVTNFMGATSKSYKYGITPSWDVDIFGRMSNTKRSAAANVEASRAYAQVVQASVIATVAKSYYTLLMLDQQKTISEESLKSWQRTVEALEALRDVGKQNDVAVLSAKANVMQLKSSMIDIQKNIAFSEHAIRVIIGDSTSCKKIIRGCIEDETFPENITQGISLNIINNRPDVYQALMLLKAAGYNVKSARADFYPHLTLSGCIGWTNNGVSVTNPGKIILEALGSFTVPILNHGALKANLKIAKAQRDEASLTWQKTLLIAGQEVNDAITTWQTANEQIESCQNQIKTLTDALEKTKLLMQNSSITYLEVLTAQQSLLNARTTLAQNQYVKIEGVINLYQAIGGM